jgi:hypothetical protein
MRLPAPRPAPASTRHVVLAGLAALALLVLPFAPARSAAQDVGPGKPRSPFNRGTFRFAASARLALHLLWDESIRANQERVACLGGQIVDSVVLITHIEPVVSRDADSVNISATSSLRQCAPPEWFGTVHTHIAKFHGHPYVFFSGPDRYVMFLWHEHWRRNGVFCLLYSDTEANCEFGDGERGLAQYGYARGNNIVF